MKICVASLMVLATASVSFASPQAQTAPADVPAGQMTVRVTVDSKSGTPVQGLTADDFKLFDNKKEQPIVSFREIRNEPSRVVIVLDTVNLPFSELSYARQQLSQFFSANQGKLPQATTFAVLQDSGLQIEPLFTTDGNTLRTALDRTASGLREFPRDAGVYGAQERMQKSVTNMESLLTMLPKNGPKRIIWVSAGWPFISGPTVHLTASRREALFTNIVAVITEMRKRQITMDDVNPVGAEQSIATIDYYQSFLHAPEDLKRVELGQLGLQVLAVDSGGLVLNGSNDISSLLQHTISETEDCYEITFVPAPGEHENEYHQLQLKMNRSGLTPHTTAGYYAQPVYPPLGSSEPTATAQ